MNLSSAVHRRIKAGHGLDRKTITSTSSRPDSDPSINATHGFTSGSKAITNS
ncbi:unnamed protein product, partial [Rotaria sp. Silwood2]